MKDIVKKALSYIISNDKENLDIVLDTMTQDDLRILLNYVRKFNEVQSEKKVNEIDKEERKEHKK